jgi:hypothetical protein
MPCTRIHDIRKTGKNNPVSKILKNRQLWVSFYRTLRLRLVSRDESFD